MVLDRLPPLTRDTLVRRPTTAGMCALLRALDGGRGAVDAQESVDFAGYRWLMASAASHLTRTSTGVPEAARNVWVGDDGRLHLRLTRSMAGWQGADIATIAPFGHGAYRWVLDSRVDRLDANVVLTIGLTGSMGGDAPGQAVAVQVARYGSHDVETARYALQGGPATRFWQPAGLAQSTHSIVWTPDGLRFQSACGAVAAPLDATDRRVYADWQCGGVPPEPAEAAVRMSLTLHQERPPADRREVEVVVRSFSFAPLAAVSHW